MNTVKTISKLLLWTCLLGFSGSALAADGPGQSEHPPALSETKAAGSEDVSYTVCYFENAGKVDWKWGLTPTHEWYSFRGTWMKTEYTKIEKFKTTVKFSDVGQSCKDSQSYYRNKGNLFAIFAATKNAGYNYPILFGNKEYYPQY